MKKNVMKSMMPPAVSPVQHKTVATFSQENHAIAASSLVTNSIGLVPMIGPVPGPIAATIGKVVGLPFAGDSAE